VGLWDSICLPVRYELISVVTARRFHCYTGIIHTIAVSPHERPMANSEFVEAMANRTCKVCGSVDANDEVATDLLV
jgi:hypothetical protein